MKMTLLKMVQHILSAMESDNVNSISDTQEALQVAQVIEDAYYSIISRQYWSFMEFTTVLEGVGDLTKPVKMSIPDNVLRLNCLRYRTNELTDPQPKWTELLYLEPCEFIQRVQRINTVNEVDTITNDDGVEMYIVKDRMPRYWTSFDDKYVYFDSYDSSTDSTIQASKTSAVCIRNYEWTVSDTFIPTMPPEMFRLLLNEAKSICFFEMKQEPHIKAEQDAQRQYAIMREQEPTVKRGRNFVNYGKRTASRGRSHSRWKGTPTSSGIRVEFA